MRGFYYLQKREKVLSLSLVKIMNGKNDIKRWCGVRFKEEEEEEGNEKTNSFLTKKLVFPLKVVFVVQSNKTFCNHHLLCVQISHRKALLPFLLTRWLSTTRNNKTR